ncbi:hypothetical protein ACFLRR_00770 [Bacteroidota bacterium]
MDLEQIQILLEKYYKGETSLKEEKELIKYFLNNEVSDDLLSEKEMFTYFSYDNAEDIPAADFEQKLINNINNPAFNSQRKRRLPVLYNSLRIAAGIAILLASYFFIDNNTNFFQTTENINEINDPQIAYNEAKKALLMVSDNMNSGLSDLNNLDKLNSGQKEFKNLKSFNTGIINMRKIKIFNDTKNLLTNKN